MNQKPKLAGKVISKPTFRATDFYGNPVNEATMKRQKVPLWEQVDWVDLGCRGWEIEPEGAELDGRLYGYGDDCVIHLDRQTLHLIMYGSPEFIHEAVADLQAAGVLGLPSPWQMTAWSPPATGTTAIPTTWTVCDGR